MIWIFSAQRCRLSRYAGRSAKPAFLSTVFVAALSFAQSMPAQIVQIRVFLSLKTCFIADVAVPCSNVGAKLRAMKVPRIVISISPGTLMSPMSSCTPRQSPSIKPGTERKSAF
jgi:hypothetical protein